MKAKKIFLRTFALISILTGWFIFFMAFVPDHTLLNMFALFGAFYFVISFDDIF